VGEDHDMAYIAMELLDGNDLTHHCRQDRLLPIKRVINVVSQVAEALRFADTGPLPLHRQCFS